MCLLKVCDNLDHIVKWGNGNVSIGETLYLIGNPAGLVGTFTIGQAAYPCLDSVKFNLDGDQTKCSNYHTTPTYRIIGDFWDYGHGTFFQMTSEEWEQRAFEKNLLACLPVVQCSNLVGGHGASGGPIFNSKKDVVGMLLGSIGGYEIGLHVSALRKFVKVGTSLEKKSRKRSRRSKMEKNSSDPFMLAHIHAGHR
ncbi:hypothetical protein RND81_03G209100 [Saponaria officinalis]|uniref:Peptidase S1 domain-containing protein n=1 Tax=Saponaria officinalis TaxID=3572 RepID=A0AAW1MC46_SAPOF